MELMMDFAILVALANSAILISLMYLYSRIAVRTKAVHPVGLAIFAGLLLLQNLLTVFAYATMAPFFGDAALPYLSGVGTLEFGGLLVLLRITV